MDLADVPLDEVIRTCAPTLPAGDMFMISYLDYRKLGPRLPGAHHISGCLTADDVAFWFSRTDDGIDLRTRHPATETADALLERVVSTLARRLRLVTARDNRPYRAPHDPATR